MASLTHHPGHHDDDHFVFLKRAILYLVASSRTNPREVPLVRYTAGLFSYQDWTAIIMMMMVTIIFPTCIRWRFM